MLEKMKEEKDISFFKKVIISIKNFEEYPKLACRNWSVVLAYMLKLLTIFSIIALGVFMYAFFTGNINIINLNQPKLLIDNLKTYISEFFYTSNETIIYIVFAIIVYMLIFIIYFLRIAIDVILLGAFGYFTATILRIHLKYSVMCKIAVHSLTLPIILNIIYIIIQVFTTFKIKYFDVMYVGISYVYIVTAILMIKSDILKNQQELTKILQEQEKIRQELEKQEEAKREKQKQEENERQREKEKEQEKNEQNEENGKEPQGENA